MSTMVGKEQMKPMFAKRLRAWMLSHGTSASAIAQAIGVSNAEPCRWATGAVLPRAYELRCLCEYTGLSADYLLGLDRR